MSCITTWWSLPRHVLLHPHMVISQDMLHCITTWWSLKTCFTVSPHGDLSRDMLYCITTWWSLWSMSWEITMWGCSKTCLLKDHHVVIQWHMSWERSPCGDAVKHVLRELYHHMVISQETCFTVSKHDDLSQETCFTVSPQGDLSQETCFTVSPHGDLHVLGEITMWGCSKACLERSPCGDTVKHVCWGDHHVVTQQNVLRYHHMVIQWNHYVVKHVLRDQ
jgi:hypothetical protein